MFALIFFSIGSFAACTERTPILLIPGVMSTVLQAELNIPDSVSTEFIPQECARKSGEFRLWQNVTFLYKQPQCNMGYLKQKYNEQTESLENLEGIKVKVPKFGSVFACSKLDPSIPGKSTEYLKPLIDKLKAQGYQDEVDLFCAGYDWRISSISSAQYITDVINLIKQIKLDTNKKVTIVSHSYGGLMSKFLFDKFVGYDKFVQQWVSVATPWKGAFLSIQSFLSGLDWVPVDGQLFANVSRQIEANYQMLPHKKYWEKADLVTIAGKSYNIDTIDEVLDKLTPFGSKLYNKLSINFDSMPTIPKYCVYSNGIETAEYGKYDDWTLKNSQITYGDGDDAVNFNSLIFCKEIGFETKYLGKYSHVNVVNSEDFVKFLIPLVCPAN